MGLKGVREVARLDKTARFTALHHHITPELLLESFHALKHSAAAGVDAVTWRDYEFGAEVRIQGLHQRVETASVNF
jgi:hypothetical protein